MYPILKFKVLKYALQCNEHYRVSSVFQTVNQWWTTAVCDSNSFELDEYTKWESKIPLLILPLLLPDRNLKWAESKYMYLYLKIIKIGFICYTTFAVYCKIHFDPAPMKVMIRCIPFSDENLLLTNLSFWKFNSDFNLVKLYWLNARCQA